MKNLLEKPTLKWIFAWFLVCCLFWVVTFADWNTLKSFRNTWWSDAPNMENKLSADTWNSVLAELDHLKAELKTELDDPALNIPSWAVMPFAWRSTCPEWWSYYWSANGKFIMGTSENSADAKKPIGSPTVWWRSEVTLTINEMPSHDHLLKFILMDDYWDDSSDRWSAVDWYSEMNPFWGNWWQMAWNKSTIKTSPNWNWKAFSIMPPYVVLLYCIKQ